MRAFLILVSLFCLFACTDDLPKPSLIDKLRVLAIRADTPESAPGNTVQLDALVIEPNGLDVSYEWYACFIPERGANFFGGGGPTGQSGGKGYSLDDPGSCKAQFEAGIPHALKLGNSATAELTISDDFLTAENTALAYDFPAEKVPPKFLNLIWSVAGLNMTVTLIVTTDNERVEAFKRINVSTSSTPNTNPDTLLFHIAPEANELDAPKIGESPGDERCFLGEESGLVVLKKGSYTLTPINIPEPQESYQILTIDAESPIKSNQETWFYSFFSTQGKFASNSIKSSGTATMEWSLDKDELTELPIWIVVRDGRGGTNWCHSKF